MRMIAGTNLGYEDQLTTFNALACHFEERWIDLHTISTSLGKAEDTYSIRRTREVGKREGDNEMD